MEAFDCSKMREWVSSKRANRGKNNHEGRKVSRTLLVSTFSFVYFVSVVVHLFCFLQIDPQPKMTVG